MFFAGLKHADQQCGHGCVSFGPRFWTVFIFLSLESLCSSSLCAAVVGVVSLVVHHQFIVHKVETVGLRLVRMQDHLSNDVVGEWGELVDVFTGVLAVGHAKPKLKIKAFQQLLPEVMPLDHPEVFDREVPYSKLNCGPNLS